MSLFFYAWGEVFYLGIMIASIISSGPEFSDKAERYLRPGNTLPA